MGIETIAIIGLGITAGGTYMQMQSQKKAAKAQQKSLRLQQRQAALKASRERIAQAREARRLRAAQVAVGTNTGVGQSTGVQGAIGGLQSGLASNLAFSRNIEGLGASATSANIASAGYASQANMWGSVAGLGTTIFGNSQRISSSPIFR